MILVITSCNNKKYTEVVEVPLPAAEEKMTLGDPNDIHADTGPFAMVKMPYGYDAMQGSIDAATMEIHYSKHYLTYTNNLNTLVTGTDFAAMKIEEILIKVDNNPDLRNNAGGYYNHTLFWETIGAKSKSVPKDTLAYAIKRDFGSYENFRIAFNDAASKQFASGWAWLITDKAGKLQITITSNQDNPLMSQAIVSGTPILALDLWEHAYYLKYQYRRQKYIESFFNVINWNKVNEKYEDALRKKY